MRSRSVLLALTGAVGLLAAGTGPALAAPALRDYRADGAHVAPATGRSGAPELKPGTYAGSLSATDRQFYALQVGKGGTGYLSATAVYPRGLPDYPALHARVKAPDGTDCGFEADAVAGHAGDGEPLTVAVAVPDPSVPACSGSGRYAVQVWRNGVGGAQVPLEIHVDTEPAIRGDPAKAAPATVPFAAPGGAVRTVTGRGSFDDAATLPGTGRYADTLQQGEFVFYRVRLDWGQGLAYRVTYGGTAKTVLAIASTLSGPARQPAGDARTTYVGRAAALPVLATLPVRYGNRESVNAGRRAESRAGWYYLAVSVGRRQVASGSLAPVPVRIDLSVVGQPVAGPDYRSDARPPQRSSTPTRTGPPADSAGGVIGPSTGASSGASAGPSVGSPRPPAAAAGQSDWFDRHWLVGVWIGALVVLAGVTLLLTLGPVPAGAARPVEPPRPRGRHLG